MTSGSSKTCRNCGKPLPATWRRLQCGSSKRHACWAVDELNKWRNDEGIQTYREQGEEFLSLIVEVGADQSNEHKARLFVEGYLR